MKIKFIYIILLFVLFFSSCFLFSTKNNFKGYRWETNKEVILNDQPIFSIVNVSELTLTIENKFKGYSTFCTFIFEKDKLVAGNEIFELKYLPKHDYLIHFFLLKDILDLKYQEQQVLYAWKNNKHRPVNYVTAILRNQLVISVTYESNKESIILMLNEHKKEAQLSISYFK